MLRVPTATSAESADNDVWSEIIRRLDNPVLLGLASKAIHTIVNVVCLRIFLTYEQQSRLTDNHIPHLPRNLKILRVVKDQRHRYRRRLGTLTDSCVPHLPPFLEELQLLSSGLSDALLHGALPHLRHFAVDTLTSAAASLLHQSPVTFIHCYRRPEDPFSVVQHFKNLQHLHLPTARIDDPDILRALPPGLLSLRIATFYVEEGVEGWEDTLALLPRTLVDLRASWWVAGSDADNCDYGELSDATLLQLPPSLTSVTFAVDGWQPPPEQLKRHFSKLRRLHLGNALQTVDDAFADALQGLASLTSLRIDDHEFTDAAIHLLPRSLTRLKLGGGYYLTDACAAAFPTALTSLHLWHTHQLTTQSFAALLPSSSTSLRLDPLPSVCIM